jgi:hypothetical protein
MRLGQVATVGALLGMVAILAACGNESTAGLDGITVTQNAVESATDSTNSHRCRSQLRPFLSSMDALRKNLVVGLTYEGYLDELREVKGAYDPIRVGRLAVGCLLVAAGPGERALNRYIDAANIWGDCLATAACETESIEPKLRRRWTLASDLLSSAQSGL